MTRRRPLDAIVVGAGVVGATTALALARDGRHVALVEPREPAPWRPERPDPRVYALAPDNAALLDSLGLWPDVRNARAQAYRHMRVWDAGGSGELRFDAEHYGRDSLGWIVENGLLIDRLWQALGHQPRVERHCPDSVAEFEQSADCVTLALTSGTRLRARLLIAADGADSPLRARAGIEVDRHDYHQRALVAYLACERRHQETAWQRFLPTGPLAFLPCPDEALPGHPPGRVGSIVWTLPEAEAERLLAAPEHDFLREFSRAFDATLGEAVAASPRHAFPLRRQLARRYVADRLLLIGDAAHVVHPLAGQGVNLGLRDSACLRRLLAEAGERDPGADHRLARYQRERRSEDTLSAHAFDAIDRLFSNDALLPTLLRGPLLGLTDRLAPLKRLLWRYAAGV